MKSKSCTRGYLCELCVEQNNCAYNKEEHFAWLKKIRLSSVRSVFILSYFGESYSDFGYFAKELSDIFMEMGYKTAILELSQFPLLHVIMKQQHKKTPILEYKGIEPIQENTHLKWVSPWYFSYHRLDNIEWCEEDVIRALKNMFLNTNWQNIDIMFLMIPMWLLALLDRVVKFLDKQYKGTLLITNKSLAKELSNYDIIKTPNFKILTKDNDIEEDILIKAKKFCLEYY